MTITVELNIDLRTQGFPQRIRATQADANTRVVEVSLYDGGAVWPIPDGVAAAVGYRKPDGTAGLYDKLPDGSEALTISENTVTAILAPQVLTAPGIVSAVIILTDDNMRQLSTFPFQIYVEKNPAAGLVISDNYINVADAIGDLNTLVTEDKTSLVAAINEIARNNGGTISDEQIAQAVADYLEENPIDEGYSTTTEITDESTDEEVPTAAAVREYVEEHSGGNVDLTGYATEQWVKDQNFLTEVPDGYAKSSEIPKKPEDIGAQPSGNYALKSEIPSVPVQSVNGKTGAVQLSAADVGARPENWMPTAQDVGALPSTYTPPDQTAEQVGADPVGTAAVAVSSHNTDEDAHNDIRLELKAISERLTAFFDSDDQTLDELSEIVSYITNNKTLIESITTIKVSVADIVNNLTSNVSNKPLSAAQGVVLKGLIDTVSNSLANYQPKGNYALRDELPTVPTKVSAFENDKGYLTQHQDISHKLDANKLPEAVNTALAQAKASGEFDGNPGKTAYAYAQEAGYTGTEEEFAEKLAQEPLIGTTMEITPSQVLEAITTGRDVLISHSESAWGGEMKFSSFSHAVAFDVVLASGIFMYFSEFYIAELYGDYTHGIWNTATTKLARYTDVPTALKNPYALTINGTAYDGSKAVNISIQGGNGDAIPDYVRAEAERVAKMVQSRQNANTITFLACSDIHYSSPDNTNPISSAKNIHEATLHLGQAMGIIRSQVHIDFAAMFGDMFRDNGESNAEEILNEVRFVNSCLHDGFSGVPTFRLEGNHDEAYESGIGLSANQVFVNIHAWNVGAVYGDRSVGYCYRDFEDVKLRVICLNTTEGSGSSIKVSAEQNTWLSEVLDLSEKGDDWCSIILSHHPLDFSRNGGVDPIPTVKTAVGLIAAFHGHIHNFLVDYINGTEVKRITIPNAVRDQENGYTTNNGVNFAESTKYPKTAGTAEDTSFCVVTIDLAAKKIYADHYGAGYSREIDYTYKSAGAGYTNLVPTSIDPSTGEPGYNTTGYKDGKYASGSSEGTDSACVLTGLIAYGSDNTSPIYIKGADVTTASHCRILGFDATRACSFQACAGTAISTYFTIETLGTSYYKLTPTSDFKTSAGFKDYLRFSLIGTGANLIITINEPIE